MNQITTLDKKLWTVQSRHDVKHLEEIGIKHNLNKEQVEHEIQRDLYNKMLVELQKSFRVSATHLESGELQYQVSGYCLTQRQMLETVKECLNMDTQGKEILLEEINRFLL